MNPGAGDPVGTVPAPPGGPQWGWSSAGRPHPRGGVEQGGPDPGPGQQGSGGGDGPGRQEGG